MSDSGDSENGEGLDVDWESLETNLSPGALESLRQHLQQGAGLHGAPAETNNLSGPRGAGEQESAPDSDSGRRFPGSGALPSSNLVYKAKDYWDSRFAEEESYDWLASYADMAEHLHDAIPKDSRVLVVGCGNSDLSADMYDDGYRRENKRTSIYLEAFIQNTRLPDLLSTDFSAVVIDKMRAKHREARPGLRWDKMDMLALEAEDGSFDAVVDKAAMDALMVDKGDPWNPDPATIERSHRMCAEVSRVLAPGGVFVQLSFEQVHFRRKFLMGEHHRHTCCGPASKPAYKYDAGASEDDCDRIREQQRDGDDGGAEHGGGGGSGFKDGGGVYGWDMQVHDIQREGGCFGHFLYIMRKRRGGASSGGDGGDDVAPETQGC
ncbi:unnamed protein product [Scytosiphon promiscuus]